jgi:hypothetical protein
VHGRAAAVADEQDGVEAAAEETGLSGIDDGGGEQRSTERLGLREFLDESKRTRSGPLLIGSEISPAVLNLNPC